MKKYLIVIAVFLAMCAGLWIQHVRITSLADQRNVYVRNTNALLKDVQTYKTKQGLNASTVEGLELKLSEFKKYRSEDAKLIQTLQVKNRDLQSVTTTQSQTIIALKGQVWDSIVVRDNLVRDTLRCIKIRDPWFSMDGCISKNNEFSGVFECRDSVLIVETVKYKRFLGFLWKTSKVKDRKIDVISKNPHSKIKDLEFVQLVL